MTLGARLCVDLAAMEAELELAVAVEFSTRMCGEYASMVVEEVSVGVSLPDVDSSVVVVVADDVVWSELLSDDVEGPVDGEELEGDKLDGALLEDDELGEALLVEELPGLVLELDEDGIDGAELDGAELDDEDGFAAGADEGAEEDEGGDDELPEDLALLGELPPELLPSKTTKLALPPFGTVTTQKLAPPTPMVPPLDISLTLCFEGSMAQGRPLQPPPSQTISTPHVGILLRNGVVGSR